jgi:hypothetical protein
MIKEKDFINEPDYNNNINTKIPTDNNICKI